MLDLEGVRSLFSYLKEGTIYFNHASIGAISTRVMKAIDDYIEQRMTGGINNYELFLKTSGSAKEKIAKLINCRPDRIAWTDSVSNGFNNLVQGIEWKAGDRVLLNDIEFPANVYPFLNLKRYGVEIDFVRSRGGGIYFDDIAEKISNKTRLLSLSLVQFLTGFRADIDELGRLCGDRNIIFSVDAIQGAGAVEVDVDRSDIDYLVCGAQKWLMAVQGVSFFYISEKLQSEISQRYIGWSSVKNSWDFLDYKVDLLDDASRFENGTLNALGITAFNASLDLFLEYGMKRIEERVLSNTEYFMLKLSEAGIETVLKDVSLGNLAGIITVKLEDPDTMFRRLTEMKIIASMREGYLRFSPHFYNTKEEIDSVVETLKKLK